MRIGDIDIVDSYGNPLTVNLAEAAKKAEIPAAETAEIPAATTAQVLHYFEETPLDSLHKHLSSLWARKEEAKQELMQDAEQVMRSVYPIPEEASRQKTTCRIL